MSANGEKLIQAIKNQKYSVVKKLLEEGCHPDCRVNDIQTCTPALSVAVSSKQFNCLQCLLKHGANVEARDKLGMTAAMHAADKGLENFLHTLAEHGADLNAVNFEESNALMLASKWDNFECVHYLLDSECVVRDINKKDAEGKTALIHAAMHGSKECLGLLIDAGAYLDATDSVKGFTALMHALEHHALDCAILLLDKGAEINIIGTGKGKETTALTLAFRNSRDIGDFIVLEKLLLQGADMTLSRLDQDFLHEMIARGKKKIVRLMVINGCPPFNRRCWEYCFKFSEHHNPISPFCVALLSGFYDIARYFIVNRFFTTYDISKLPNDQGIRQKLQEKGEDRTEEIAILNLICSAPQALRILSFTTVSDIFYTVALGTKRNEHIIKSGLPGTVKSDLLFKAVPSLMCLLSWHELNLDEDQDTEPCKNCGQCDGKGYRVKKRQNQSL